MKDEASLFRVLGDPTRLRLATLLAIRGETCVCMLAQAIDEPDFKVSRHLGVMRSAGVVCARREGTWMYYTLVQPRYLLEERLQACLRDSVKDNPTVRADLERLAVATCSRG